MSTQQEEKGTFRRYVNIKFTDETMAVIVQACAIIDEYESKGFSLTLRQLYYQFVARGMLENKQANYNRLGSIVSDGRLAGLISWTAIEDRTRNLQGLNFYSGPAHAARSMLASYRLDMWANQPVRPEVWVEKEALVGVIAGICNDLRVDFFACKGYNSQSEQWRAGRRLAGYVQRGQRPMVFHVGDHDPSGLDMTRDNRDRLSMFAGVPVQVVRLALNMDQIERFNPPPNPVKMTDSRYGDYARQYGEECWELDALAPDFLASLIGDAVVRIRDAQLWDEALRAEAEDRQALDEMVEAFGGREGESS